MRDKRLIDAVENLIKENLGNRDQQTIDKLKEVVSEDFTAALTEFSKLTSEIQEQRHNELVEALKRVVETAGSRNEQQLDKITQLKDLLEALTNEIKSGSARQGQETNTDTLNAETTTFLFETTGIGNLTNDTDKAGEDAVGADADIKTGDDGKEAGSEDGSGSDDTPVVEVILEDGGLDGTAKNADENAGKPLSQNSRGANSDDADVVTQDDIEELKKDIADIKARIVEDPGAFRAAEQFVEQSLKFVESQELADAEKWLKQSVVEFVEPQERGDGGQTSAMRKGNSAVRSQTDISQKLQKLAKDAKRFRIILGI